MHCSQIKQMFYEQIIKTRVVSETAYSQVGTYFELLHDRYKSTFYKV